MKQNQFKTIVYIQLYRVVSIHVWGMFASVHSSVQLFTTSRMYPVASDQAVCASQHSNLTYHCFFVSSTTSAASVTSGQLERIRVLPLRTHAYGLLQYHPFAAPTSRIYLRTGCSQSSLFWHFKLLKNREFKKQ